MLRNFFADREFFRAFLMITLPITGQNILQFSVSIADAVMVGQLGDKQLAAVQQANQVGFLMIMMIFGLVGGANVMIAQYWGKGDTANIHKVMTVTYRVLLVIVASFSVAAIGFPEQIMRILGVADITEYGAAFLRIAGWGYALTGFSICTLTLLRSVSTVRIAVVASTLTLVVSVFGNWVFIFGNLGMPALGVRGAALTTVIARVIEACIVLAYMLKFERKLRYPLRNFFSRRVQFLREFARNALPVFLNESGWGIGFLTLTIIIGHMGAEFIAAISVNNILFNLLNAAIFGAGSASAVIIGNTVGSGRYNLARSRMGKIMLISLGMGILTGLLILALRAPFLMLFGNLSDVTRYYAYQVMAVNAAIIFFQSISLVAVIGVLRGGGDGKFAAIIDIATMWLVALPLGFFAGHVWGLPIAVVFFLLKIDEPLKAIICLPRLLRGNWVNDVTLRL